MTELYANSTDIRRKIKENDKKIFSALKEIAKLEKQIAIQITVILVIN